MIKNILRFFLISLVIYVIYRFPISVNASTNFKFVSNSVCYNSQSNVNYLGFPRYSGDISCKKGNYRIRFRVKNFGNTEGQVDVKYSTGLNPFETPTNGLASYSIKPNSYIDGNVTTTITSCGDLVLFLHDASEENPYIYNSSWGILNSNIQSCSKR